MSHLMFFGAGFLGGLCFVSITADRWNVALLEGVLCAAMIFGGVMFARPRRA